VLTFILDIVLVEFQGISYHVPSMICKVIQAYEGEHLSNIVVYGLEYITQKGGMYVIEVSFSQPGSFHGPRMELNTTDRDKRMGYKKPFILPKVTATCNILNHTLIYSISLPTLIVVYHHHCLQNMSTNGSPPKTVNMAHPSSLFGTQQSREENSDSSENSSRTATGKDSRFGTQTN